MIRVFLAGEGRHELGGWVKEPPYVQPDEMGVVEALLRRCAQDGWVVSGARRWKDIPKFQVGQSPDAAEARTVRGLALLAAREGHHVLAFVRDSDHVVGRVESIEEAVAEIREIAVIGGVAVRTLDAWCLALRGRRGSERLRRPKEALAAAGCVTTVDRVALVQAADLDAVPDDARSLGAWIDRATAVLGTAS